MKKCIICHINSVRKTRGRNPKRCYYCNKEYGVKWEHQIFNNITSEQTQLENELKNNREEGIKIPSDFHSYFCTVLKQETERNCDCYGLNK